MQQLGRASSCSAASIRDGPAAARGRGGHRTRYSRPSREGVGRLDRWRVVRRPRDRARWPAPAPRGRLRPLDRLDRLDRCQIIVASAVSGDRAGLGAVRRRFHAFFSVRIGRGSRA